MTNRSALRLVAAHGSTSYGPLDAERLREILLGSEPIYPEHARVYQGLTETPLYVLSDLAREIGVPLLQIEERFIAIYNEDIRKVQQWQTGDR